MPSWYVCGARVMRCTFWLSARVRVCCAMAWRFVYQMRQLVYSVADHVAGPFLIQLPLFFKFGACVLVCVCAC